MESRGRGIRGRNKDDGTEQQTPISTAWADFMTEEGMAPPTTTTNEAPTQKATTTKTTTTASSDKPREYTLPLTKEWIKSNAQPKQKKARKSISQGNLLVQTGTLDSSMIGRHKRALDQPYDLQIPTSIMPSLQVSRVIASCNAAHALCIDTAGVAHGWGRNEAHQLSQSLPSVVPLATRLVDVPGLVVDAAVGKSHTMVLTNEGLLYAVGANKSGQCGVRNFVDVPNFRKCVLDGIHKIVQVRKW